MSLYSPETIADGVSRWTNLGVKFPKELADAIEMFETVRYVEVGRQVSFDLDSVTTKNAEDKIREYAAQLALSEVPGGGLSILDKAKNEAVETAARLVNSLGRQFIPDAIEQISPTFDAHAQAYVNAVAKLPADLTSEKLVLAGADAVTTYAEAQREARYLEQISAWVVQTGSLAGVLPKHMEVALLILRPADRAQLAKLDSARVTQVNSTLHAIHPVYFTAAQLGVEFGINTLKQAAQLRSDLERVRPQDLSGMATLTR